MERRQYRFKKEYYLIDGVYNIPGLVIFSGNGYDFKSYCCKNCGEIFVFELELLQKINSDFQTICSDKTCPNCNNYLLNYLVEYPENIFYNGLLLTNKNPIDRLKFDETEAIEIYLLK